MRHGCYCAKNDSLYFLKGEKKYVSQHILRFTTEILAILPAVHSLLSCTGVEMNASTDVCQQPTTLGRFLARLQTAENYFRWLLRFLSCFSYDLYGNKKWNEIVQIVMNSQ